MTASLMPWTSKDIAFYTAGRKAVIEAIRAASPIMQGTRRRYRNPLAGAIGRRSGRRSVGQAGAGHGHQRARRRRHVDQRQVPLAELDDYQGRLKSLTGGQGSYSIMFSHYAAVPTATRQQLASQHKVVGLDDD